MKGGVILFRGAGAAARRYLESDRSTADEYYLEGGTALAEFTVTDARGQVIDMRVFDPEQYAAWVDWTDPISGTSMGTPRSAGKGMRGSPRFAEIIVNAPKSLSLAAALHPEVSDALDAAQRDAAAEIRRWLAQHSVTRVGPRQARQIGTRVYGAGKWRGLDTAALFKQQGAIRALGTAVIAAHPQLAQVLDAHGLTLDPVTGEVAELEPYNAVMSKRGAQVERNLARFEVEWEAAHPGEEPGPVVRARLKAKAWEHERPGKKPTVLGSEAGWRAELEDAGYTPDAPRARRAVPVSLDELHIERDRIARARPMHRGRFGVDGAHAARARHPNHDGVRRASRAGGVAGVRATGRATRDGGLLLRSRARRTCSGARRPPHITARRLGGDGTARPAHRTRREIRPAHP